MTGCTLSGARLDVLKRMPEFDILPPIAKSKKGGKC